LKDRAQGINQAAQGPSLFNIPVTSQVISYVTTVNIGNPPTNYTLLIDTGSSNTWVGADQEYEFSNTTVPTLELFSIEYGSGYVEGFEVQDQVTLAPGLTIENQIIGVAVASGGFDDVDGILGIGPQSLTCGNQFPDVDECVPTVTDNAWAQGLLGNYEVGISFAPAHSASEMNGELTFGGVDPSKFTGTIDYVPITSSSPANRFVGIDQSVSYGDVEILSGTSGIVDTGTTLLLLATDAFEAYQSLTNATMDNSTGLLEVTREQYLTLESMFFHIGGTTYELTRDAQTWPRALNADIGGDPERIYLIVADNGEPSGSGIDFINGMAFLERFYAVYDVGNSQVGFATTRHTKADSNQ